MRRGLWLIGLLLAGLSATPASAQECFPPCRAGYVCSSGSCVAQPVQAQAPASCFPACREGYLCSNGQCVSACNPPCGPDQQCSASGQCVASGPYAAPATPPPAETAPPPPAPPQGVSPAPLHTEISPWGAPAGAPPPAPARSQSPGFSILFGVGPAVGWFYGGQLTLGFSIRLADPLHLAFQLHGGGGPAIDSSNTFATGIGEVNLRIESWRGFGGVGAFGFGTGYLHEFEGGCNYGYVTPHVALGGGFMVSGQRRFAFGVEGKARLGYAINTTNDCYFEDYSGFYGALEVMAVFHI